MAETASDRRKYARQIVRLAKAELDKMNSKARGEVISSSDRVLRLSIACSKLAEAHHQIGEEYGYLDPLTERVQKDLSAVEGRLATTQREEERCHA
jgi:hypothetical protein